ncbi:uncharacterized protein K452DRAFT_59154 [Aplosporella prunicola CBS 121167]|uniref:Enoyl reductase (ER) domain-containing protein n=1 Tax=Aplosporella prunicola CBS 121167 TaxID=1176127 RepID=A0A6A6BAR2_9PEZI|nr:uncharacterized protein K452DRAFT_59154 [Aplosporella prunicola CBS 121167]KAF2139997.1 hypothetical protein K452DRAFT_59154 [Aplosporella prunicola CBS 121167]
MKEAIVYTPDKVEIVDSPIPTPGPDQVVIKVIVSGSNPKDWKHPEWAKNPENSGDDIAGTIHSVGSNVYEFKPGDRVAAFHEMAAPHGSFAEYAVAWSHTTTHIPAGVSFEEAATLPLAALTAVVGNYDRLQLPHPWQPAPENSRIPLIVYGAATAVGAFAIQLAQLSNVHPVIGVAGNGIPFAESLIDKSKGDAIVDYRGGDDAVRKGIADALKAAGVDTVAHAFDAVSEKGSNENITAVLAADGRVTNVLPPEKFARTKGFRYPDTFKTSLTYVGDVHGERKQLGFVYFRWMARMLQEGKLKPHPHEVVPGGLDGVSQGLQNLKAGKASAVKYVFRITETEGAGKD